MIFSTNILQILYKGMKNTYFAKHLLKSRVHFPIVDIPTAFGDHFSFLKLK